MICLEIVNGSEVYFVETDGCLACETSYAVECADAQCKWCDNIGGRIYFDTPEEVEEYKQFGCV